MDSAAIAALYEQHLMRNYKPLPVAFARGEGCRLWDVEGREYLDFVAGIAVMATGHSHPRLVAAVQEQAARLIHTSNLYYIEQQARLAERLTALSFADRCFFCNSGTEANEAAIKLARKWAGSHDRGPGIVAALASFHGRTLGALSATGQEKYQRAFQPLIPGFGYVPFGDLEALAEAVTPEVCAVLLEPIQAEGGMNVPGPDYLRGVRDLCDERGVLLILDEVQTGLGRTGKWFAYQHAGIEPDVMTLAKALGSGLPIGACLARESAAAFEPGDHAATFGGNHLCCAAALATLDIIESEGLVERAAERGKFLTGLLTQRLGTSPAFREVRGLGLLRALVLDPSVARAPNVQNAALRAGLIVNAMGEDRLRLAPPLIVSEAECRQAVDVLAGCLGA
jgi:predicted acetylornithine/succinylornithine family transaminase